MLHHLLKNFFALLGLLEIENLKFSEYFQRKRNLLLLTHLNTLQRSLLNFYGRIVESKSLFGKNSIRNKGPIRSL